MGDRGTPLLTDAHVHFTENGIRNRYPDIDSVATMLCCSAGIDDWSRIEDVGRPGLIRFYGVHPWRISEWNADTESRLERVMSADPSAGVGEIGLDSKKSPFPMAEQIQVLGEQLDIAERYGRIVNIHTVGADDETVRALKGRSVRAVIHGFSNESYARQYCRCGAYLSVNPRILARSEERVRRLVSSIPEDRLLLESDAPFTPPFEGMYVFAQRISDIMGIGTEELLSMVSANMSRLLHAGNGPED